LFSLEPPEQLKIGTYRCDSRFFLEPLQNMMETKDSYGVVVMDGREATLAIIHGTETKIVKKLNSMAHAKIRKGGQCLASGTLLVKGDGEIIDVENFKLGSGIVGLDFSTSKTSGHVASDFFVTPAKHSIIIETKCPAYEIRATPYHRFFVLSEHGVKEKFAKDLDENDRILIAKKINCGGGRHKVAFEPDMRIILDENERKKLRDARIRLGSSQKKAAESIGVSQMIISYLESGKQTPSDKNLRKIYTMYGLALDENRLARKTLALPECWDENLARLLGIICGDGTEDGNRIIIYEGSKELVEDYCRLVKKAIGVEPVVRMVDKTGQRGSFAKKPYYEIRIYSLEFVKALAQIAPETVRRERDVPKDIPKCDNRVVAAFLSGLYDAEGYMHGNRVDIAMTGKKLMQKVQLLLLRLGILSSFSEKKVKGNKQWCVSISDKHSLRLFRENIGFTRSDKKEKLEKACNREIRQQYADQIPIDGREVFRLAKELGLKTSDFHAASCFFRNKKPLGREAFAKNILSVFGKHANSENGKRAYDYLRRVHDSDVTVAAIKSKTAVESRENFHDITIPVHSNFIANGFVVHNSARRYERLIEESIEKYYKRVGESMDVAFLGRVKGVIVGGPGPTKEFFMKMSPFNYQIKVMGVVDTGYTDEYGVREVLEKSSTILAEQEAIKERIIVERFIREVVSEGLATYGEKQVRDAIISKQAEKALLSEGLDYIAAEYTCPSCGNAERKITKEKPADRIPCAKCNSEMRRESSKSLLDDLEELATQHEIPIEIISTNTTEGAQFLTGFGGIGAFLRYKTR
ncbi:helix-turn-helix domain-containing protein, partial [Candidatus Micrarchaeota archaeon]|nr:helix-turn-helix domain-containing protein [Candidatus Micrarchaeota archaeon]